MTYFNVYVLYVRCCRVCGGNEKCQSVQPVTRLKIEFYTSNSLEHLVKIDL
jgi:hypothetical protein